MAYPLSSSGRQNPKCQRDKCLKGVWLAVMRESFLLWEGLTWIDGGVETKTQGPGTNTQGGKRG